jgi:hypothetical protein
VAMVRCSFCEKEIEKPRKFKGKIVQKFCSSKCRFDYHNGPKKEERARDFINEMMSLLKKYGFIK